MIHQISPSEARSTADKTTKVKTRTHLLLSGLIILAAGIVLIICNKTIKTSGIVTVGGVLFILAGIINGVMFVTRTDSDRGTPGGFGRVLGIIVSVASAVLGLAMLIFDKTFSEMVQPLFGVLLVIGALIQLYVIMIGSRPVKLPAWTYGFPAVLTVLAIILFMNDYPDAEEYKLMIITGVGLVVFGLAGFVESFLVGSGLKALSRGQNHAPKHQIEDVKAEEVGTENAKADETNK